MHEDDPTRLAHAEVVGPVEKQWCRVRFADAERSEQWARIALPGAHRPGIGDEVLTAVSDGAAPYVIGLLEQAPDEDAQQAGALAFHEGTAEGERLGVRDERGRVLFEYRPAEGRAVVSLPDGDLELRAGGNLDLVSGAGVRVFGATGVDLESAGSLELRSGTDAGTKLRLDPQRLALRSDQLEIDGRNTALRGERLEVRSREASLEAGAARVKAHRLETIADRIVQRARSLQQVVEGLHQQSVGRMRQLVRGVLLVRSGRFNLRGKDGVKIDGDKIHLG